MDEKESKRFIVALLQGMLTKINICASYFKYKYKVYYLVCMSLPWEVLRYICDFCELGARYRMSLVCHSFKWRTKDWQAHCRLYQLAASRGKLRRLICRDYSQEWCLHLRNAHIWSDHLNRPLTVWTPFTNKRFINGNIARLYFSELRFINFMRHLGCNLELKLLYVLRRRMNTMMATITVWDMNRVVCAVKSAGTWSQRRATKRYFESSRYRKVRALIEFRIANDALKPHVRQVQFSNE